MSPMLFWTPPIVSGRELQECVNDITDIYYIIFGYYITLLVLESSVTYCYRKNDSESKR